MKENTEKVKVYMLPTDKESKLLKVLTETMGFRGRLKGSLEHHDSLWETNKFFEAQHLYFTSYEKIKQGDIVLHSNKEIGRVTQFFTNNEYEMEILIGVSKGKLYGGMGIANAKKIVSTTNPELWIKYSSLTVNQDRLNNTYTTEKLLVPVILSSFLQPYIESYNAGTPITEVLLETETIGTTKLYPEKEYDDSLARNPNGSRSFYVENKVQLKLRADNSVIIHPVKEKMYTRDELKNILLHFVRDAEMNDDLLCHYDGDYIDLKKWFNENYLIN